MLLHRTEKPSLLSSGMKSSLSGQRGDTGEERSAETEPSVLSNSKSSGSSMTTSTATTNKKDNSKKDKPLTESPEEREMRKKEKREKKKEGKEHETPEEKAKRREKRKKEKESKVSSTSTGIPSPESAIAVITEATSTPSFAETLEERVRRHKEKKQRKKEKKEEAKSSKSKTKTSSSPKDFSGEPDPSTSHPKREPSISSSVSTPTNSNVLPEQRYSDIASFYSSASASESTTRDATSSSSESSDHGDKMSVSVMTDPYFGPQQEKSDRLRSLQLQQQYQLQLQQQYQQQQERQQMEQHQQYRQQLPSLQQHFQQAVPYMNRSIPDSDYGHHNYRGTPAVNGSIGLKGMLVDPNAASTSKSVMDDMSVCNDDECNSVFTGVTEANTMEVTLHQQKFLLRMVKTMSRKVEKAEAKIRSLGERNYQMEGLAAQLTKSEDQLEYATEDNNDYSVRVRALEQALLMQETELDNALETIRQQEEAQRELELRKVEREAKKSINPFAVEASTNPFAEETSTNPFAEETVTNPFAGDESDELLTTREEVEVIREELAQLQHERDMAVERVTTVAIQLAELRAGTDESRDRLAESLALIERLKAERQQSSSSSIGSFLWAKKDAKSVMSTAADEAIDGTEYNSTGSVSSVAWPHSDHSGDATYEVGRRHDEASYDLVL